MKRVLIGAQWQRDYGVRVLPATMHSIAMTDQLPLLHRAGPGHWNCNLLTGGLSELHTNSTGTGLRRNRLRYSHVDHGNGGCTCRVLDSNTGQIALGAGDLDHFPIRGAKLHEGGEIGLPRREAK